MSTWRIKHPFRWLFLAWAILVYFWGLVLLSNVPKVAIACLHSAPRNLCSFPNAISITLQSINAVQVAAFTALMLLHGIGLWLSLGGWIPQRFSWLYLLLQGGFVFLLGFVVPGNVVLSLYLVLALQAISLLQRARFILVVASGLLVLFIMSVIWNLWMWEYGDWGNFLLRVATGTDYTALLPFVVGYLVLYAQQVRSHTQLATTHAQLQVATAQIEELTLTTERQRMARELHDTLAQSLAGLIRQLDIANLHLARQRPEQAQEIIQEASAAARGALTAARCAIDDLRTATATPGDLIEAVREEIERFTTATGIPCTTDLQALGTLPAPLCDQALRAIGEGLTNVARHAQARQVWIHTTEHEHLLTIDIRDDGVGFVPSLVAAQTGHYGLLGLRERTRLAGGQVEISSRKGAGTSLHLQFPLSHKGVSP